MYGSLIIDKPAGITSARVVDRVKRLLPRGMKIGHAGTLDPFATGVLVLLIGKSTRRCEELMNQPKLYLATIKLGATTATDDPESEEFPTLAVKGVDISQIQAVLPKFVGKIMQRPPAYSAIKVGGRRSYDLARKGESLQLEPRPVMIYRLEILSFDWPMLQLEIECGRGTYIRSIARDLGEILGTGGYLTELRRTRVGPFTIDDAIPLDRLTRIEPEQLRQLDLS